MAITPQTVTTVNDAVQGIPLAWRRRWPVPVLIIIAGARVAYDQIGFGFAPLPLGLALFPSLPKDVVRDGVPGIVNANEEQEQRRSAHQEQGWARMGVRRARRYGKHCV